MNTNNNETDASQKTSAASSVDNNDSSMKERANESTESRSSSVTSSDDGRAPEANADSANNTSTSEHSKDAELKSSPPPATRSEEPARPLGKFNACFEGCSKIGPLALLFALFCMSWPIFWQPMNALYCPAEIKTVTAFLHSIASGSWLAPVGLGDGGWTMPQWPVFSWAAGLIALSPGIVDSGYLLPTTTFLCTFFAVLGVWCTAHAAGFGYKAAFAAGLILLCAPIFAPLPAFVGPATLASGLLLFALVFFCRGWQANAAWFSLPIAFLLTALAFLTGGWFFLLVPLIASFCFLIWRGELKRAHRSDAIFGYILMIGAIGCWLGWIMLNQDSGSYLGSLFSDSVHLALPVKLMWFAPIALGILGTLPWLLLIFGVSWYRVLASSKAAIYKSRHEDGSALIWISLVIALPIALFTQPFHPAAVCIACLAATLLGKAINNLGSAGNRFFCLLASLCLIAAGCAIICASFDATRQYLLELLPALPVPDLSQKLNSLSLLPIVGGIVALGGILALAFVKRFSGNGPLIYAILLVIILCQVCRLKFVHELASMPGSPLVTYAQIEGGVLDALATPLPDSVPINEKPEKEMTAPSESDTQNFQPSPAQEEPSAFPVPPVQIPDADIPASPSQESSPAIETPTPASPPEMPIPPAEETAPQEPAISNAPNVNPEVEEQSAPPAGDTPEQIQAD